MSKINNTIKSVAYSLGLDEDWLHENLERLRSESAAYVEARRADDEACDCKCNGESCK